MVKCEQICISEKNIEIFLNRKMKNINENVDKFKTNLKQINFTIYQKTTVF